jgi:catechol 2,3-dioxygenase-like lactoylglutathione lyase family enzyme
MGRQGDHAGAPITGFPDVQVVVQNLRPGVADMFEAQPVRLTIHEAQPHEVGGGMTDSRDTPPVKVRCFSHLGVTVSNLDVSVDFYMRVLGFTRLFKDIENGWSRIGLGIGDIQLELFSPPPPATSDQGINPFYPCELGRPKVALTVDDVAGTYERLVAAGVTPLCPIVTTPASKFFFISDPDGTPIQLHEFLGGQQRVTELFRHQAP